MAQNHFRRLRAFLCWFGVRWLVVSMPRQTATVAAPNKSAMGRTWKTGFIITQMSLALKKRCLFITWIRFLCSTIDGAETFLHLDAQKCRVWVS